MSSTVLDRNKRQLWKNASVARDPVAGKSFDPINTWNPESLQGLAEFLLRMRSGAGWLDVKQISVALQQIDSHVSWFYAWSTEHKHEREARRKAILSEQEAENFARELSRFAGRWVAVKGYKVLHSGSSPTEVVLFLRRSGLKSDSMFRVPTNSEEERFVAP